MSTVPNIKAGLRGSERSYALLSYPLVLLNLFVYEIGKKRGKHQVVFEALREIKNLDTLSKTENSESPRIILAKAKRLMELECFVEAEDLFKKVQKKCSEWVAGFDGAAHAAMGMCKWDVALGYLDKAEVLIPDRLETLRAKAYTLGQMGRTKEAEGLYERIFQKWSWERESRFEFAKMADRDEAYEKALQTYDYLWKRFGKIREFERWIKLLLKMERLEEVESIIREAPSAELSVFCSCLLFQYKQNWPAVAELLLANEKLTFKHSGLFDTLIVALTRLGRYDEALALVERFNGKQDGFHSMIKLRVYLLAHRKEELERAFEAIWNAGQTDRVPIFCFAAMITAAWEKGGATLAYSVLDKVDADTGKKSMLSAQGLLSCFHRVRVRSLERITKGSLDATNHDEPLESVISQKIQASSAHAGTAFHYREIITLCEEFARLRKRHTAFFPDASFVFSDALAVIEKILDAVENSTPLSLIRLGDGEGYFLPYRDRFVRNQVKDQSMIQRAWWGKHICRDTEGLGQALQEAIADADIIGIPDMERVIRVTIGSGEKQFFMDSNARGILAVLDYVRYMDRSGGLESKLLTSCHIHEALGYWRLWDLLLPKLRRVSLITCREQLGEILAKKHNLAIENIHLIPPEKKGDSESFDRDAHYPYLYEKIKTEMASVQKGQVLLIAAGFLGKMYCMQARAAGGIAIDIGSAADIWCGYGTRDPLSVSEYRGIDALLKHYSKQTNHPTIARLLLPTATSHAFL